MKKLLLAIIAISTMSLGVYGQAPQKVKYQAVVRDGANTVLNNQAVGMRLTVQQGSIGGTAAYTETFATTTNAFGLVNLDIGTGTTTDDFTTIDWSAGPYFVEIAVDITGGVSYSVLGTSQLLSVPYALHSKTAENVINDLVDDADADATNELQTLSVSAAGDTLHLQNGGFVIIPGISAANAPPLAIGDSYQGGIIFYLDGSGGGLIAAPTDQSSGAEWGCNGTIISGADGTAIGTGAQNTIDIEAGCSTAGTAADICANLVLSGYTDWFLPSKDELNLMYQNIGQGNALGLGNVGGFAGAIYWSSSEIGNSSAWTFNFVNGIADNRFKDNATYPVRAVRAF